MLPRKALTSFVCAAGGSIGIAIMTTLLARNMQVHQTALAAHTSVYDPAFQQAFEQIRNGLLTTMDAASATEVAYRQLYAQFRAAEAALTPVSHALAGMRLP